MIVQELIKSREKKGKIEGKIEAAKNLINLGVSMEIVIKSTGLSKEDLQKAGII
jgi:predicted transposase/invertase (TIGR01784 family)